MHRFTVKGMARKVPTFEFNLNASTPLGAALAELTGRLFALSAMGAARHLPTLGLLSIFRDEAPWMWEWLAHHALEGAKPLSRISTSSRHWSSIGEIFKLPKLPVVHIVDNSATPHLTEKMGSSRKTEHFSVGGCNSCASLRSDARLLVRPPLLNARPARRQPYQSHRYATVARHAQHHAQPLSSNLSTRPIKIEVAIPSTTRLRQLRYSFTNRGISVYAGYTLLVKQQQLHDISGFCTT
jgi:hypothetical protein